MTPLELMAAILIWMIVYAGAYTISYFLIKAVTRMYFMGMVRLDDALRR